MARQVCVTFASCALASFGGSARALLGKPIPLGFTRLPSCQHDSLMPAVARTFEIEWTCLLSSLLRMKHEPFRGLCHLKCLHCPYSIQARMVSMSRPYASVSAGATRALVMVVATCMCSHRCHNCWHNAHNYCMGGPGPPLCGFLQLHSACRKFETFQDDTGAFPGSPPGTLAGEPGAQILWTQDSSTELLPSKFAMPA